MKIYDCVELVETIHRLGFLPLLKSGIAGFSANEMVDEQCRYVRFPDGGWDWPMWKWKGEIVTEGECVYGKFFASNAGFISMKWWPDFCNYRRNMYPEPEEGSIEEGIVMILQEKGSMITRDLRDACGFTGPKMRGKFETYLTRLEMACRIVTQDFVYPTDRHGTPYGWGRSLLTTPEQLYGKSACACDCAPEESFYRIMAHLRTILPDASERQIERLIR